MGTRGIYGFRKNGIDKLTYNHFDSYPDYLGATMAEFCADTPIDELNALYDRIELVNECEKPTEEQINACRAFANVSVGTRRMDDWYCLLRELQGEPEKWKEIDGTIYMIDNHNFILDSLFCEYGYIINLDTNELEFWEGYQKKPNSRNRYGKQPNDDGYYPCRLAGKYSLWALDPTAVPGIVADMNKRART